MCRCVTRCRGCLCDCDVSKAFHGIVECGLLLVVDVLDACIKHVGIPLNLLNNVKQSSGDFIVSLHVIHSHVIDILVCRRNDLNDTVVEGVADQGYNAW